MTQGTLICTRCGKTGHVAASCTQPVATRTRGMATIDDLRRRSDIDAETGCWVYRGAFSAGVPKIHTFDHAKGEKRVMSGPSAVWNIAFGESPGDGYMVFRCCQTGRCVNPWHHRKAWGQAGIGQYIAQTGRRKGTAMEARRASAAIGRRAYGIVDTPDEVVIAIAKDLLENGYQRGQGKEIAARHGVTKGFVSRIATGVRSVPGMGRLNLRQFAFNPGRRTSQASIDALRRGIKKHVEENIGRASP